LEKKYVKQKKINKKYKESYSTFPICFRVLLNKKLIECKGKLMLVRRKSIEEANLFPF